MSERFIRKGHEYVYPNESLGFLRSLKRGYEGQAEHSPEPELQEAHDYCSRVREHVVEAFSRNPEWKEECIKEAFLAALFGDVRLAKAIYHNQYSDAARIKYIGDTAESGMGDTFAKHLYKEHCASVDFSEPVKKAFIKALQNKDDHKAFEIQRLYGEEIDFSSAEGYEEAVHEAFWDALTKWSDVERAKRIQERLGKGMDFKPKDPEKAKDAYYRLFGHKGFVTADMIRKLIDDDDFLRDPERMAASCKEAIVACLRWDDPKTAFSLLDQYRQKYDPEVKLHKEPGFKSAVKRAFFHCINQGDIEMARKIRDELIQPSHFRVIQKRKWFKDAAKRYPSLNPKTV